MFKVLLLVIIFSVHNKSLTGVCFFNWRGTAGTTSLADVPSHGSMFLFFIVSSGAIIFCMADASVLFRLLARKNLPVCHPLRVANPGFSPRLRSFVFQITFHRSATLGSPCCQDPMTWVFSSSSSHASRVRPASVVAIASCCTASVTKSEAG